MMKLMFLVGLLLSLLGCSAPPERNCNHFKTGKFSFKTTVDGKVMQTVFTRTPTMEIDYFQERADTSSIRWINECEYVLKNRSPKNSAEEKSIHIKILTTSDSSYTFEYNVIGDQRKFKGTAFKIH